MSLEVRGATKAFGSLAVLRDLNLSVEPGEFAAVIVRAAAARAHCST